MKEEGELLVIAGPTASGKSALALEYARREKGEIISMDSMQLYRDLPIGTAQPTAAEREEIRHHLVGIYPLTKRAEVYEAAALADRAVEEVLTRGKLPVICGGTGLYLRALLYGLDDLPADRKLRAELDARYDSETGGAELLRRMRREDPAAAEKWGQCRRRLIRALEVRILTGKSLLELQSGERPPRYKFRLIKMDRDREELKSRIRERAEKMLKSGWIEEAERVIGMGLFETPTAYQAIGYRQIGEYLAGKLTFAELHGRISTVTWQYARRQRTWFAHQL